MTQYTVIASQRVARTPGHGGGGSGHVTAFAMSI